MKQKVSSVLIGLFISALALQGASYGSEVEGGAQPLEKGPSSERSGAVARELSVSTFDTREEAEKLAAKIAKSGYETVVRSEVTEEGKTVYKVYIVVHGERPEDEKAVPGETPHGNGEAEEKPVGVTKSFGDLFGGGRFYHASLALTELYTDNAFLSKVNKKSGSSTVLSPEIRLSFPRAGEALTLSDISTMAPGGVVFSKTNPGGAGGSGAYLLYHADIPIYSNLPSENTVTHKAAAGYIYNGNRVSIGVSDEFLRSYDETLTGIQASPLEVDKFNSNLLDVYGSYDTGNRFKLMIDYSHFLVDYDAAGTGFRNLGDDSVAGYVFYKIRPKTSLFVEYDFIDISHTDDSALDSREHNISVGIQWDLTAKSKGIISAGYGVKDMAGQGGSFKNYIFQAQISHQLNSKNDISFSAYRMTEETDYLQTLFLVSTGIKADYNHRLTTKISASAGLGYEREDYEGAFSFGGVTKQRRDTAYDADLSLRYEFKRWLKADIGYTFRRMNSNFGQFEYSSNTLFIRLMTAI